MHAALADGLRRQFIDSKGARSLRRERAIRSLGGLLTAPSPLHQEADAIRTRYDSDLTMSGSD
jgi:hypothetical protein